MTKFQRLWKARGDRRKEEAEKLRTVRIHEVADSLGMLREGGLRRRSRPMSYPLFQTAILRRGGESSRNVAVLNPNTLLLDQSFDGT